MWERSIDPNNIVELRCKSHLYFGCGAIEKIYDIAENLKKMNISKILIVSSKSAYKVTGAWDVIKPALEKNSIEYALFDQVTPNPTESQVDTAVKKGLEIGAEAVVGIGGGSPIDTAKSAAILLKYKDKNASDLYEFKFIPEEAVPVVAINTTHGTGTEVNRFAVVSLTEKEYKPAIAYDCIYPIYSIDDPNLMVKLPANQTRYVSVDAVNHVIEAATTIVGSPFAITLAKETVKQVVEFLPRALENPEDQKARYFLLYASALGGISFDNGLLHFTHALEHPLSAVKPELAHGLGLAMILPAVIRAVYPAKSEILADLLSPIFSGLKGTPDEANEAARQIENWLFEIGITRKLSDEGFTENDIDRLTELALTTPSLDSLISLAPVKGDKETIAKIYMDSLQKIN